MVKLRKNSSQKNSSEQKNPSREKIRYAVVGLGYIAQVAVLPAFKNAANNSTLAAIVSSDKAKLKELGDQYNVNLRVTYEDYDDLVRSTEIDAVYIALPNSLHMDFALSALENGKHVLCEKPLALTTEGCRNMIDAAHDNDVKLMTAYRLHFEEANLKALEVVHSGQIGEPRIFTSVFSFQIKEANVRLERKLTGGTLYDLGVYCINASRHIFQNEPEKVFATSIGRTDPRFSEVDEMTAATMVFPKGEIATFTSSFGASDTSMYEITGTKGSLRVQPAYDYAMALEHHLTIGGKTKTKQFKKVDQFAPELIYFSNCIIRDEEPEPSGIEGLADVRIVQALYESSRSGETIHLGEFQRTEGPTTKQHIQRPSIKEPELFKVESPAQEDYH